VDKGTSIGLRPRHHVSQTYMLQTLRHLVEILPLIRRTEASHVTETPRIAARVPVHLVGHVVNINSSQCPVAFLRQMPQTLTFRVGLLDAIIRVLQTLNRRLWIPRAPADRLNVPSTVLHNTSKSRRTHTGLGEGKGEEP